ncbi:hypothetical protein EVAR_31874_1 [Eumeta japonica]|uniref:Uncharacterized protein n=1 Tax=Eumeta variegata TaxID=151549 RepID=A0A4C1WZ25_EUMVA|nr:hypothetical protein EVAR_31874_1 [Eumeta japonica]
MQFEREPHYRPLMRSAVGRRRLHKIAHELRALHTGHDEYTGNFTLKKSLRAAGRSGVGGAENGETGIDYPTRRHRAGDVARERAAAGSGGMLVLHALRC